MGQSVENLCNQLARLQLLEAAAIRSLRQRWLSEAGNQAEDATRFGKWLVVNKFLTDFQVGLLLKGSGELLRCEDYILVERIGQGRMAGVYRAVHNLGQVVAIKVLPPSKASNPQVLARFQREARMAAQLDHPNVVRTFQQGTTKAGLHYIVMEFLDGESLEDTIKRRKRLPVREAIHVLLQALAGLQHIFEKDMIHRDLKSGNLMLVPGPRPGQPDSTLASQVKILDIGLGRSLFIEGEAGMADNPDLTTDGAVLGTPAYMAPEQARNPRMADIRADLYSLGCVLYECLSGAPPFTDENFMRQVIRHATETPCPLTDLNPEVPKELQTIVEMLLAKDPAQRYATPEKAARALQAIPGAVMFNPPVAEPGPVLKSYLAWLAARQGAAPALAAVPVPSTAVPAAYRELAATVPMPIQPAVALAQPLAAPAPAQMPVLAKQAPVAQPQPAVIAAPPPAPAPPKQAPVVPAPAAPAVRPPVERPATVPAAAPAVTVPPPSAPPPVRVQPVAPVAPVTAPTPAIPALLAPNVVSPEPATLAAIPQPTRPPPAPVETTATGPELWEEAVPVPGNFPTQFAIRPRDLLWAGAGAGILLVVEGVIWLFFRLLSAFGVF